MIKSFNEMNAEQRLAFRVGFGKAREEFQARLDAAHKAQERLSEQLLERGVRLQESEARLGRAVADREMLRRILLAWPGQPSDSPQALIAWATRRNRALIATDAVLAEQEKLPDSLADRALLMANSGVMEESDAEAIKKALAEQEKEQP